MNIKLQNNKFNHVEMDNLWLYHNNKMINI